MTDLLERCTTHLNDSLFKQNKPTTYKLLSRALDVSVSDAKRLLYTYYKSHVDQLQATYIIIGQPRDSVQQTVVKLTNDLEDQSGFEKVESVNVYSLSAKNITVDEVAQMVLSDLEKFEVSEEKMVKWGLIKGPKFVEVSKPVVSNASGITTTSTRPTTSKSETATTATTATRQQGGIMASMAKSKPKEEEQKKNTKKDSFPDMTSEASKMFAKLRKDEPVKKKDTQQTIGARSLTSQQPSNSKKTVQDTRRNKTEPTAVDAVEVIEDEHLNDEEYIKKQRREKQEKTRKQKELEAMFDDDDDDDFMEIDPPEEEEDKKENVEKKSTKVDKEESQSKNADLEEIFDTSFPLSSQSQSQSKSKSQTEKPKKVKETFTEKSTKEDDDEKPTTYIDEDGFIVTKLEKSKPTTSTTAKSNARPAPQSKSTSTPATKKQKTGGKQQSSLASFFGKKK